MLKIQSLASGSKGNCIYIASGTTHILVDIGISLPELLRRMESAEINPETITAILITHEHIDHIKGVSAFLRKYRCALYLQETAESVFLQHIQKVGNFPAELACTFNEAFAIGDITINFFPVSHDSAFCFGYTFESGNCCKIALATDLGRIGTEILAQMANSQVVLLESNHDLIKLHNNVKYPAILKRRISGSNGHLSNASAALAVYELAKLGVQQIMLAHLSEQNNTPTLAYTFMRDFLAKKGVTEGQDISIDVCSQNDISRVFQID